MEDPKSVFTNLARLDLSKFTVNQRPQHISIAKWMQMNRVKEEEFRWVGQQQVIGSPSLTRLRAGFSRAGFQEVSLKLHEARDNLDFRVRITPQVGAADSQALLRLWIQLLRQSGFRVGFCEVGITEVDGVVIRGCTMTDEGRRLFDHGPPAIEEDEPGRD